MITTVIEIKKNSTSNSESNQQQLRFPAKRPVPPIKCRIILSPYGDKWRTIKQLEPISRLIWAGSTFYSFQPTFRLECLRQLRTSQDCRRKKIL